MNKKIPKSKQSAKSLKGARSVRGEVEPFERVETGIQGLDQILHGGFLRGGTYLILGAPGTGKTIFANQLCFHQIRHGGRAVYVTLLAESHTRMFGNLRPLQFFQPDRVADDIQYISGYSILEKEGLDGLLRLLRDLVYQHGANILFIDGVASADELSGSTVQFKKFVHHLNSVLGIAGCTTFLLSSAEGDQTQPEYTMVDGILKLTLCQQGMKIAREVEVSKFRGSPHYYGKHFLEITESGISVFPRIEAAYGHERPPKTNLGVRKAFGIQTLDRMLRGGLIEASTTALLGPAGTGKTQLGMQFLLAGAQVQEPGLLLSMYEHPDRLAVKLDKMNKSYSQISKKGMVSVLRRNVGEHLFDKVIFQLLSEVENRNIKRLFIDGMNGFRINMLRSERLVEVLTALFHELRARGVTVIMTEEADIFKTSFEGMLSNHSEIMDNIFEFRHVELDTTRIQALNVVKIRESDFDNSIRELLFTKRGIDIGAELEFTKPYLPAVRRKG